MKVKNSKSKILVVCLLCLAIIVVLAFVVFVRQNINPTTSASLSSYEQEIMHSMQSADFSDTEFCEYSLIVTLRQEKSVEYIKEGTRIQLYDFDKDDFSELLYLQSVRCFTPSIQLAERQLGERHFTSEQRAEAFALHPNLMVELSNFRRILSLRFNIGCRQNILNSLYILNRRSDILAAEPNIIHTAELPAEQALNTRQEVLTNLDTLTDPNDQWGLNIIQAQRTWEITRGSPNVVLGLIDTGIQSNHPDLADILITERFKCLIEYTIRDRVPEGAPFNNHLYDYSGNGGHGTMTAGIIGAQGKGSHGVAPDVRLVSLRAQNGHQRFENSPGDQSGAILAAIVHASQLETFAPILNISMGDSSFNTINLRQAIEQFGGLVIASAGNNDQNNDTSGQRNYPASFRGLENLISVGASDRFDNISVWQPQARRGREGRSSNFGRETVHLFAPGGGANLIREGLMTATNNGSHGFYEGTSAAAPHVAATAALMLSINPSLTPLQIRQKIIGTVDYTGCYYITNHSVSGGRLNTYAAVRAAQRGVMPQETLSFERIGNTNTARVTGLEGSAWNTLTIPSFVIIGEQRLAVTQIASGAFQNNQALTQISLPALVATIGDRAFSGASSLHTINLPNSLTTIGADAFEGSRISKLDIPASITDIGNRAFMNNRNLQEVSFELGSRITQIREQTFYGNSNLNTIRIPEGVTHIGYRAFLGANNLTDITLPSTLRIIGRRAFQDLHHLQHLQLPQGLVEIWSNAFTNTQRLRQITIPDSVTNIGANVFSGSGITEITLLGSVPSAVNASAFGGATVLRSIFVPRFSLRNYLNSGWSSFANLLMYADVTGLISNRTGDTGLARGAVSSFSTYATAFVQPNFTGAMRVNFAMNIPVAGPNFVRITIRNLSDYHIPIDVIYTDPRNTSVTFFADAYNIYSVSIIVNARWPFAAPLYDDELAILVPVTIGSA